MVKPEFVTEPEDKFVLPNSPPANLLCEARFVSNLNFHCTGGLVQRKLYDNQTGNNVKLLIVELAVSAVLAKSNATDAVCTCVATGYQGQVVKSRSAAVKKACKWIFVVWMSCFLFCFVSFFFYEKSTVGLM